VKKLTEGLNKSKNEEFLFHDQELIIFNLNNLSEDKIKRIVGWENFKKAQNISGYKIEFSNYNKYNIELIFEISNHKYIVTINFKNIRNSFCDCGEIDESYHVCSHIILSLLYLKNNVQKLINFFYEANNKIPIISLSEKEIKKKQEELLKRKQTLEYLNLDPELVEETLAEVENFIYTIYNQGLQRFSAVILDWANQLFIKTQIAKLANLNKQFKIIAELINKYLNKSTQFDLSFYKTTLSYLTNYYILTRNLLEQKEISRKDINPEILIGKFRSEYIEHPDLDAQCIGMEGLCSQDAKFIGITGYYLNYTTLDLFTITQLLPIAYFGNDPKSLYHRPIPGINESMADLAHGAFHFSNVKFNDKGNLSLHKNLLIKRISSKLVLRSPEFQKFRIDNWMDLIKVLCQKESSPIPMRFALNEFFALEPKSWGLFEFDPILQEYKSIISDKNQKIIVLRVKNEPFNKSIIENLQYIYKNKDLMPNALFGNVFIKDGLISVRPISLFYYYGIKKKYYYYTEISELIGEFHLNLEDATKLSTL